MSLIKKAMGTNKTALIIGGIVLVGAGALLAGRMYLVGEPKPQPQAGTTTTTSQEVDYQANCANAKIPKGTELDISADPATGLVTIGYHDETGQTKQVVMKYKTNDNFAWCSDDAKRILIEVRDNEKGR